MIQAIRIGALVILMVVPTILAARWVGAAADRAEAAAAKPAAADDKVAVAAMADEGYCSADLKKVLRRVLQSCGLIGSGQVRGCHPVDARNVATMSGEDFNALFLPMKERGGIIQFELDEAELESTDQDLVEQIFADQQGASYFFVVARASPDGSPQYNRELSKARAEAVMSHLRARFDDPALDREVGLLWLGEEYAQLDQGFCDWRRSGATDECKPEHINRSAFIAWIDCRL